MLCNAQYSPKQQGIILFKMSIVPKLRNCLKQTKLNQSIVSLNMKQKAVSKKKNTDK